MDLNLVQLRALVELAELHTMAAVARSTGYTPGAVSQQIAQLEKSVGQPLIEPDGRRVRLTELGLLVARQASKLLAVAEQTRRAIAEATAAFTPPLLVGMVTTASSNLLPRITREAEERHPGLRFSTVELQVDEVVESVRSGRTDLGIGIGYPNLPEVDTAGVTTTVLFAEDFLIAMSERQAAASAEPRDLRELADWGWILPPPISRSTQAFRQACQDLGFTPRVVHEVSNSAAAMALVSEELGILPVTPMMLTIAQCEGVAAVPLQQRVQRNITLVRRNTAAPDPRVDAVVEAVRAVCADERPIEF